MERVKGIEPSSQAWEARILPLNHTRFRSDACIGFRHGQHSSARRISIKHVALWQLVCVYSLRRLKPVNGLAQLAFNQLLPFR